MQGMYLEFIRFTELDGDEKNVKNEDMQHAFDIVLILPSWHVWLSSL